MFENTTLARPYAKAAFSYAFESGKVDAWNKTLVIVAELVKQPEVANLINHPKVKTEDVLAFFAEFGEEWSDQQKNLLRIMAENKRLRLLPEVAAQFERLRAESQQTLQVDMLTARPVVQEQQTKISTRLKQKYQREIQLNVRLVPELIGGAVLKIGDRVIDGSIRGYLTGLANALGV
jgi:F-type H+-transporting ATPase subunit delta